MFFTSDSEDEQLGPLSTHRFDGAGVAASYHVHICLTFPLRPDHNAVDGDGEVLYASSEEEDEKEQEITAASPEKQRELRARAHTGTGASRRLLSRVCGTGPCKTFRVGPILNIQSLVLVEHRLTADDRQSLPAAALRVFAFATSGFSLLHLRKPNPTSSTRFASSLFAAQSKCT